MSSTKNPTFAEMQLIEDACAAFQNATRRFKAKPLVKENTNAPAPTSAIVDVFVQFDIRSSSVMDCVRKVRLRTQS